MRNVKLTIEYEGTNYYGWQVQRNQKPKTGSQRKEIKRRQNRTVQETIEKVISKILQEKIKVTGSGRTDSGVHARGQVANFRTKSKLSCKDIQKALNSILPEDIRIRQVTDVPANFHARFDAQSKVYRYTIVNHSFVSPHLRYFCHLVKCPLDVKKMRQGAQFFLGRHNFRSFQAVDKRERHPLRTIKLLDIRKKNNLIYLDIEADGLLYRMARNIVGTLIEVGRGRLKPQDIKKILKAKNRISAGPCAAAKGLCLIAVRYKS